MMYVYVCIHINVYMQVNNMKNKNMFEAKYITVKKITVN